MSTPSSRPCRVLPVRAGRGRERRDLRAGRGQRDGGVRRARRGRTRRRRDGRSGAHPGARPAGLKALKLGIEVAEPLARVFEDTADRMDLYENYADTFAEMSRRLEPILPDDPRNATDGSIGSSNR